MNQNIKNQTPEERMITTLRFAKNTMYTSGICGKLFQIAHYCDEIITANQGTELSQHLDALDSLRDFALRAKRKNVTTKDMIDLIRTISEALNTNTVAAHA